MVNKRGQTLVLFIVLIPLILCVMAFVVDIGLITYKKSEMREVAKTTLKEVLGSEEITEEKIKNLLIKNEMEIKNLEIKINNKEIHLKNNVEVDSLFGAIIGWKTYKIKVDLIGYYENDLIVIE